MLRLSLGFAALVTLCVTFWVNPSAAWMAVFSGATLALAHHIRRRDEEAEQAAQRFDS